VVRNDEYYEPACDCHLYDNRCCSLCGIGKSEYAVIYTKIDQAKQPIKQDNIKYRSNGKIKNRGKYHG